MILNVKAVLAFTSGTVSLSLLSLMSVTVSLLSLSFSISPSLSLWAEVILRD